MLEYCYFVEGVGGYVVRGELERTDLEYCAVLDFVGLGVYGVYGGVDVVGLEV